MTTFGVLQGARAKRMVAIGLDAPFIDPVPNGREPAPRSDARSGAQVERLRVALHVGAGVLALGLDLEAFAPRMLERSEDERGGDTSALERAVDLGVLDRHHAVIDAVLDAAVVAVERRREPLLRRLVLDRRRHARECLASIDAARRSRLLCRRRSERDPSVRSRAGTN